MPVRSSRARPVAPLPPPRHSASGAGRAAPGDRLLPIRWLAAAIGLLAVALAVTCAAAPNAVPADSIRVVSQTVGTDELLLAVAAPDQIAALSHLARDRAFSAVSEEAKAYPQIVLGDAETILRYHPTLVLVADYSRPELVEQVRRAGVRVLSFDRYESLDDAFANLRVLARELGPDAEARAARVIADYRGRVTHLAERLQGATPVRVIAPSTYGRIPGDDTTFQDLCAHAAATNLAATLGHLQGHEPPPDEQMLTWPIDRVVLAGDSVAQALAPYRTLAPYAFMPAIREQRVALLAPYMLSCVSHHRVEGYERLARELHPDLFR